ncbi:MAG: methyltransferase [Alcanivorax sp.]
MGLSWKDKAIQNFDRCAHSYEQYGGVQDIVASHLAADLPFVEGGSILEIGCGTGLLTKHLVGQRHLGLNLHVTDISSRMVQQAKANLGNHRIHWSILDAEKQQSGQKYDLIIASMACQWFEDFQRGMKNVVEMLNPGGTFYFSLPGPDSFKEWRDTLKTIGLSSGMLDFHVPKGLYKEEMIIRPCQDSLDFLRSLKNLGAASARKNHQPLTIPQMKAACAAFDAQNFKQITWHILYGRITKNQETRGMHV